MLTNLINRINKDENIALEKEAFIECGYAGTMHSHVEKFSFIDPNVDFGDLKEKLASVTLDKTDTIENNMNKLISAAKGQVITETVVSTSKSITMTKEDFDRLSECIKILNKESSEQDERKNAKKEIKAFLKACTSEIRKCNDDRPADALVVAMINKLCKAFECVIDDNKKVTKKALLILKLNALAKAISNIK